MGSWPKSYRFPPPTQTGSSARPRRAGLDALCLTEHFNTLQFADVYGYIASVSRRTGDALELENGLKIFPGMETDVAEGATSCPSGRWRPFWS